MKAVGCEQFFKWEVEPTDAGLRVDKFVALRGKWSRSLVQSWLAEKRVTVDGTAVKANYRLRSGEQVRINVPPPPDQTVEAEAIPLDVVYEDAYLIVVNKPRGMVVHPAPGHASGTLVNALLAHCDTLSDVNGKHRAGIVHRLDKDTSGLIVAAKDNPTHEALAAQFAAHTVNRSYIALVHGRIPHERGTIDAPIGRNPVQRQKMAVTRHRGKAAVTHFVVSERFMHFTLLKCRLQTGRMHQIRVHLAYIGHPVVGDPKYGPKKKNKRFAIDGQALHAHALGFIHPKTGKRVQFTAALPRDVSEILNTLRSV